MNARVPKSRQHAKPGLLDRYVTTFEPTGVMSATQAHGYRLIGCTPEGYPLFEAVKGAPVQGQLVYETPLFEEFIPETCH